MFSYTYISVISMSVIYLVCPYLNHINTVLCFIFFPGEESDIQDFVPLSPQLSFSADANQLVIVPDEPPSPRRKVNRDRLSTSPVTRESPGDGKNIGTDRVSSPRHRLKEKLSSPPLAKETVGKVFEIWKYIKNFYFFILFK